MGFPRQEYWSGSHFLLQGVFPTQDSNPSLPHCSQILYQLNHQRSSKTHREFQRIRYRLLQPHRIYTLFAKGKLTHASSAKKICYLYNLWHIKTFRWRKENDHHKENLHCKLYGELRSKMPKLVKSPNWIRWPALTSKITLLESWVKHPLIRRQRNGIQD